MINLFKHKEEVVEEDPRKYLKYKILNLQEEIKKTVKNISALAKANVLSIEDDILMERFINEKEKLNELRINYNKLKREYDELNESMGNTWTAVLDYPDLAIKILEDLI